MHRIVPNLDIQNPCPAINIKDQLDSGFVPPYVVEGEEKILKMLRSLKLGNLKSNDKDVN